jgi:hypothetical protein
VKFEQLGEAIAALGTSLGQSLGQTLQEGWLKHNMSNTELSAFTGGVSSTLLDGVISSTVLSLRFLLCKLNRKWIGICHIPSSKARVISESDSS